MSKPVKALLRNELVKRLSGVDSLAVISLSGVDAVSANTLRRQLRTKNIRVTVVKNAVAKQALKEVGLDKANSLLEGPCALAVGGESVVSIVRELIEQVKTIKTVGLRGALMENEVFGPERLEELSKYPTRKEAIAGLVALVLSPGSRLAGAVRSPGGKLAGAVKAIEDKAPKAEEAAAAEAAPAPAAG